MRVELTDISQGVSVRAPTTNVNRLHFKTDEGKSFSVAISSEAMQELLRDLFGEVKEKVAEEEMQDAPEGATQFGEEEPTPEPVEEEEEREYPQTEEDVPSL